MFGIKLLAYYWMDWICLLGDIIGELLFTKEWFPGESCYVEGY